MRAHIRRKLDMAARVRSFCRAHPDADASYEGLLKRFEEQLAHAEQLDAEHRAGQLTSHAASEQMRSARRVLHRSLIPYLVRVGAAAGATKPEIAEHFTPPRYGANNRAFLTAVRAMQVEARANQELMVSHGLSTAFLDELDRAVADYGETMERAHASKGERVRSREALTEAGSAIAATTAILDGLNRFRFRNDPELQAAWESMKASMTPSRAKLDEPGSTDGAGNQPTGGTSAQAA